MKPYYTDDWVTIYHGDCREWMPDADVLVTDPPYGMEYRHGFRKGGYKMGNDGVTIVGDDEPFDPSTILAMKRPTVLFGANHYSDRLPPSRGWIVWDKRDGDSSTDQSDAELAWTNVLTVVRTYSARWRGAMRQGREQLDGRVHVNQKPVALMAWVLGFVPTGAVLDPYAGSGSTLVAAKVLRPSVDWRRNRGTILRSCREPLPSGDVGLIFDGLANDPGDVLRGHHRLMSPADGVIFSH